MKNIFLISFLVVSATLSAQYEGYLGKKFILHYTTNGSLDLVDEASGAFNGINYNRNEATLWETAKTFYHLRHNLNVEYLQNRGESIMGGIGFYRLGYGRHYKLGSNTTYHQNIVGVDLVFYKKYYIMRNGGIAPIGHYLLFGTGISYNKLHLIEPLKDNPNPIPVDNGSFTNPLLLVGGGLQKIMFKSILWNLGIEFGLLLPFNKRDFEDSFNDPYERLLRNHAFKVKFGIAIPSF